MNKKETSDIEVIQKFIDTSFFSLPVFALTPSGKTQVRIIEKSEGSLIIESPTQTTEERILAITSNGNLITVYFKVQQVVNSTEYLIPYKMIAAQAKREVDRIELKDPFYYVSSISNQNEIVKTLNFDSIRIKNLLNSYSNHVKGKIELLDIYISERQDIRLKLMGQFDKPIFVPNKLQPKSVKEEFVPYNDYYHTTKSDSRFEKFNSEICIPLKYKNAISYGYLAGFNSVEMNNSHFNLLNIVASSLKKDLLTGISLTESKEKAVIADVSREGLSFHHPNSAAFSKIFVVGATILFDFYISDSEKFPLRAVIRSIKPTEKSYRIGCQFYVLYPEERKTLESVLNYCIPKN